MSFYKVYTKFDVGEEVYIVGDKTKTQNKLKKISAIDTRYTNESEPVILYTLDDNSGLRFFEDQLSRYTTDDTVHLVAERLHISESDRVLPHIPTADGLIILFPRSFDELSVVGVDGRELVLNIDGKEELYFSTDGEPFIFEYDVCMECKFLKDKLPALKQFTIEDNSEYLVSICTEEVPAVGFDIVYERYLMQGLVFKQSDLGK